MADVKITIFGGNNQIIPNATQAVQNFYGKEFNTRQENGSEPTESIPPEWQRLAIYISKEKLPDFLEQISHCITATEIAQVVVNMIEKDSKLTKETIVTERFISLLLPFALNVEKGATVCNLRQRINDVLAKRPRK